MIAYQPGWGIQNDPRPQTQRRTDTGIPEYWGRRAKRSFRKSHPPDRRSCHRPARRACAVAGLPKEVGETKPFDNSDDLDEDDGGTIELDIIVEVN